MSILGNILWFICGGLLSGLSWVLAGLPVVHFNNRNTDRLTVLKFAGLAFFPFGKEVVYGGGAVV